MSVIISKISDDWVTKGCHVHVGPVELVVRPNHKGGLLFRSFFRSTSRQDEDAAIRVAWEWLKDDTNRKSLSRKVRRAVKYMQGNESVLMDLARGRCAEFHFLSIALSKMGP